MGQSYAKRGLSKSATNKVVNFNFLEEDVSFDRLKKLREDVEAQDIVEYFSIKELSDILKSGIRRIESFCKDNNMVVSLQYYKKFHRLSNVITFADAEYVIKNFK
jgi:hypothetical protein